MPRTTESAGRRADPGAEPGRGGPRGLLGALEDPVSALRRMSDEVERLFHDFMGARAPRGQEDRSGLWTPQVEVSQRGGELVIGVDLPGTRREDVQVEIEDGRIVIRGERRHAAELSEAGVLRSECSYGRFYRAVPLPEGANGDAARAAMRDGVLEISLPMPPRRPPRRLDIEDRDLAARDEARRQPADESAAAPGGEQDRRQGERRDWQGEGRLGM
jgi:HSP20 family protein